MSETINNPTDILAADVRAVAWKLMDGASGNPTLAELTILISRECSRLADELTNANNAVPEFGQRRYAFSVTDMATEDVT